MKRRIIEYSVTFSICLIIAFLIMLSKKVFWQEEAKTVYHILTDSFFASGVFMTGFGLLVFATNEGSFDMLVYGIRKLFVLFKRNPENDKYKTFYDYRQAQREKQHGFGYMIIVGVLYIGISMIFLTLYFNN